ncbi:hypothetical protein FB451DRAFT_1369542 [Mycena latifolia]|nr:hypothetical protein FB451DRAFT_1369542 [Mycena latifolia]
MLRPRLSRTVEKGSHEEPVISGWPLIFDQITDATRIHDSSLVALKLVDTSDHPDEVEIHRLLISAALASDPRNHCIPLLDTLHLPNEEHKMILVMRLMRAYEAPRFDTCGEVFEFFRQIFEAEGKADNGLGIAMTLNTQPTALSTSGYRRRLNLGKLTWLIKFWAETKPSQFIRIEELEPATTPVWCPHDPFPVDGDPRRVRLPKAGFDFMWPLSDMVQDDPTKQPTMGEVNSEGPQLAKIALSRREKNGRCLAASDDSDALVPSRGIHFDESSSCSRIQN